MPFDVGDFKLPVETKLEPWRQVLLDAAKIVRQGWCQKAIERDGAYCAIGAMNMAEFGDAFSCKGNSAYGKLWDAVGGSVATWNNAPGRTAEEVASTMEKVARG